VVVIPQRNRIRRHFHSRNTHRGNRLNRWMKITDGCAKIVVIRIAMPTGREDVFSEAKEG